MSKGNRSNKFDKKCDQKRVVVPSAIRFKTSLNNTILDVMKNRGWTEVSGEGDFDFYWCDAGFMKEIFDHGYLEDHIRICHFRNHYELTRKNLMVKNLKRLKKKLEKENIKNDSQKLDFFPTTFELPSEYHMFLEEFKKNLGSTWIMKPVAKSQGKGIFLFRKIKDIEAWKKGEYQPMGGDQRESPETYVVSYYINDPYLICGRKFDLRVYLLVTSFNPMRVWLYREGFARFSNVRFSPDSIDDQYVHLTNVAVQKTAPEYDPEKGAKWSLYKMRRYLIAKHGSEKVEELFRQMDNIFIQTLVSVQKTMINDKHCFELYGYDILLDSALKPWLLEINASPSLTASSREDYLLKCVLLEDVLTIVDMEGRLTGREKRVGGFDLMWDDGPVVGEERSPLEGQLFPGGCDGGGGGNGNSFLGCCNDRDAQLKVLYRDICSKSGAVPS